MSDEHEIHEIRELTQRGFGKNRIEALADGIFAVAMTLLVLDIKVPDTPWFETSHALALRLVSLEHSFAMYAISFVVLGMFWFSHHLQFHYVRRVDHTMLWINLAFLLTAVLVPFSTDLIGDHGHLRLPVLIYGANLLVLAILLLAHLRHLAANPELAAPGLDDETVARMRRQLLAFAAIAAASMATSLLSPWLGIYLYVLLAVPAFVPGGLDRLTRSPPTDKASDDARPR